MRIVTGELRGRRFNPPPDFSARPTTDFAKENLFNVLENFIDFESVTVLDLFSGTGSISYEFASRGCRNIVSVEQNFKHQRFIAETIRKFGISERVRSLKGDAFKYIANTDQQFDIIFADPPFDMPTVEALPDAVFNSQILKAEGLLIIEHSDAKKFASHPLREQTRCYGKVNFTFFRHTQKPNKA